MNKYAWRNNILAKVSDDVKTVRAKLAFKTKETDWLNTNEQVVVLISTHSEFHTGLAGDLKMQSMLSTIKNNVRGKICVLLCDGAHLHAMSLKYQSAQEVCSQSASQLVDRYRAYFDGCDIQYWHRYICQDDKFTKNVEILNNLYKVDPQFQNAIQKDAEAAYTDNLQAEFSNRSQFLQMTIKDIVAQCACLHVLAENGYRFLFYPGRSHTSTEYANKLLLPQNMQLSWINVFLSIEKKSEMRAGSKKA